MLQLTLIFGLIYFGFSLISLIFHFIVGLTLIKSPKFKKFLALRMMIFLSLSDGLQLIIHMFSGILVIGNYKIDPTINMTIGFIAMFLWNATIFQQTVLAIDRLYVLSRPKVVITSNLQINILIGFSWLCAFLLHIGYVGQGERFWFSVSDINWFKTEISTPLLMFFHYLKISLLVLGLLAGLGILVLVLYQHYHIYHGKTNNKVQSVMEIRLFIQTCFSPALGLFNVIVWTCCKNTNITSNGILMSGLFNLQWILINSIQPYLGLLFSRKLRNATLELLKMGKHVAVTTTIIRQWSKIRRVRRITPIIHRNPPIIVI